jgi:alkaline phosphatase D
MHRRRFLGLGLGGAALAASNQIIRPWTARGEPLPGPFAHGVASGDPLPDRLILWTRVSPTADATPGSGLGPPTFVEWDVATDEAFAPIVRTGSVTTDPATDHTVKVDADGLPAGTTLWYRFRALGATSLVGRARTAPATSTDPGSFRAGVVSCSNWEGGYFSAYRHLADRDDLDLVLHLGDYLYEYGVGGYGPGSSLGRTHDPAVEMVSLEDYRRRHAQYKTDPDLRRLHQRYSFVTTWDDHETTDDCWANGAVNHQPGEGDFAARKAAARQAYFEWMPVRATGGADEPARVWRHLAVGTLADVFVLDERTYRSEQAPGQLGAYISADPALDDPSRTMLGDAQLDWLETGLDASTARWRILANGVMFAPFILPPDLPDVPGVTDALLAALGGLGFAPPIVFNPDQWDGYRAEQQRLVTALAAAGDTVVLTGDIHSSWAAEVPADPGTYLPGVGGPTVAVEFICPAVTSDSLEAAIAGAGAPSEAVPVLIDVVPVANPWIKELEAARQGFGVFEVDAERAQFDWFYVSDRTDPNATLVPGSSWRSLLGSRTLERTSPLGPRVRTGGVPAGPSQTTTATTSAPTPGAGQIPATGVDLGDGLLTAAAAALLAARASRVAARPPQAGPS